jgi:hypothetical protein
MVNHCRRIYIRRYLSFFEGAEKIYEYIPHEQAVTKMKAKSSKEEY